MKTRVAGRRASSVSGQRFRVSMRAMIRSFRCAETEKIFSGERSKKFQAIARVGLRKLFQLHQARTLGDLRLPGNSLESLKGSRAGQPAIRINDQFRLCFVWQQPDAYEVEIVDYH